jgi:hypothetical protein
MNVWSTKKLCFLSFYHITVIENQACKQEDKFYRNKRNGGPKQIKQCELTLRTRFKLKFCNCALEYLNLWEESFDGTSVFNWINLYSVPEWSGRPFILQHQNFVKFVKESEIETTYLMSFVL